MTDQIGYSTNSPALTREMEAVVDVAEPSPGYQAFVGRISPDTVTMIVPGARRGMSELIRRWRDVNRAAQAGILCNNPIFMGWIGAGDKNEAAEIVRTRCHVESRREFDTTPVAGERFDKLSREFFDRHNFASLEESMRNGPGYEPTEEPTIPDRHAVKASRKRVLLLTVLLLGGWPWQHPMQRWTPGPVLVRSGKKFKIGDIAISVREHDTLVDSGLIRSFIDDGTEFTIAITDLGRSWLKSYWSK